MSHYNKSNTTYIIIQDICKIIYTFTYYCVRNFDLYMGIKNKTTMYITRTNTPNLLGTDRRTALANRKYIVWSCQSLSKIWS